MVRDEAFTLIRNHSLRVWSITRLLHYHGGWHYCSRISQFFLWKECNTFLEPLESRGVHQSKPNKKDQSMQCQWWIATDSSQTTFYKNAREQDKAEILQLCDACLNEKIGRNKRWKLVIKKRDLNSQLIQLEL